MNHSWLCFCCLLWLDSIVIKILFLAWIVTVAWFIQFPGEFCLFFKLCFTERVHEFTYFSRCAFNNVYRTSRSDWLLFYLLFLSGKWILHLFISFRTLWFSSATRTAIDYRFKLTCWCCNYRKHSSELFIWSFVYSIWLTISDESLMTSAVL